MDLTIGERDPTMDTRIVHSVSVTNKKEQVTLRHKERSLKSAKDVQEHIHRREEKDLIRQLTKLQDEKYRRHPNILTSRSRAESRLSGSRPESNLILQVDNASGHLPSDPLSAGKSRHNAAIGTSFHRVAAAPLAAGKSIHHAVLDRRRSSNIMPGLGTGPSMHHAVVADLLRGHGGSSRHTSVRISPQMSQLMTNDPNPPPPPVHQPAGYGHTIKEYVSREGLNKRRPSHSYMEPKVSHRRPSMASTSSNLEEFLKGSQTMLARPGESGMLNTTGSRFMLNSMANLHQAPRESSHMINLGPSLHRAGESMHRVAAGSAQRMSVPSRFQINRLFGGQSVKEVAEESEQQVHPSDSDDSGSTDSKHERVIKIAFQDDHDSSDHGSNTKVRFKEEQEDITPRTRQTGPVGKSDHVVSSRRGSGGTTAQDRKKSPRKAPHTREHPSHKPTPLTSMKATSKSAQAVKLSGEIQQRASTDSKTDVPCDDQVTNDGTNRHKNQAQIPLETLHELRAALGNNLQGEHSSIDDLLASMGSSQTAPNAGSSSAYDPSSNSMQNRRFRARLRALQFVNSQMEALKQQKATNPMINFDPLEVLRCRYLRLSKSNVESLTEMCSDLGIEVGLHPHMNIDDVRKYTCLESPSLDRGIRRVRAASVWNKLLFNVQV